MNWNRSEIKGIAKNFLKKHYWKAFIVCLIVTLVGGLVSGLGGQAGDDPNIEIETGIDKGIRYEPGISKASRTILLLVFSIVFILFKTIIPLLKVGKSRFFVNGLKDDESVRIGTIISTFDWDEAWPIIKTDIIKSIHIFLWTLLLIIPGIIKSYEYFFTDYILAENPTMKTREVLNLSKQITSGQKLDIFMLEISFLGWNFLGVLALGIGVLFVNPYPQTTYAVLYNRLSENYFSDSKCDEYFEQ